MNFPNLLLLILLFSVPPCLRGEAFDLQAEGQYRGSDLTSARRLQEVLSEAL